MDQICVAFPVLPGQSDAAHRFFDELEARRKREYAASEQRIGISKEVWYLAPLPAGPHLIAYMEAADFGRALSQFSESHDPFDLWFKERLAEVTGIDLNSPPPLDLPRLLSAYAVA